MSQKNEILPLLLTVMVTSAILGGVAWWLINKTVPISETLGAAKNIPEGLFNYGGSTSRLYYSASLAAISPFL